MSVFISRSARRRLCWSAVVRRSYCADPDSYSASSDIAAIRSCNDLDEGKRIHQQISSAGLDSCTIVGNFVIAMYARCGSAQGARQAFDKIHNRNLFSWTLLITAFAHNGCCGEAIHAFRSMDLEGIKPSRITLLKIICACCDSRNIAEGRNIHVRILQEGSCDVYLSAALINLYAKCGCLEESEAVFSGILVKDGFSWTAMLRAYVERGEFDLALVIYWEFLLQGMRPKEIAFLGVLSACASLEALSQGRLIHSQVVDSGFESNSGLGSRLIHFYGRCRAPEEAIRVLQRMESAEVVPWNSMLATYSQLGLHKEAVELFHRMDQEGLRSCVVTFISAVDACGSLGDLARGKQIHRRAAEAGVGSDDEVLVGCLVNMYGKCGDLEEAKKLLDRTPLTNLVSCTALITAYLHHGRFAEALELFHRVEQAGTRVNKVTLINVLVAFTAPDFLSAGRELHRRLAELGQTSDVMVTNALISMYGKCGSLSDAKKVFDEASRRNAVTWNSMIGACAQGGNGKLAVEIFRRMDLAGMSSSSITLANVLEGCVRIGDLARGREIHAGIRGSALEQDENVRNLLINMYTKCGSLSAAEEVFFSSTSVVAWTSMIAAFARHGRFVECLRHCRRMEMEGIKFNQVTFLTVLFACSHAGFVEQGCHYFVTMRREGGIEASVEMYCCVVDLLARGGWLREAEELIGRMDVTANRATWLALLGGCKIHRDVGRAVRAAEKILELDPGNSSACSLLDDVCYDAHVN